MNRRQFIRTSALLAGASLARGEEPTPKKAPFRVLFSNDTTNITTCVSPYHQAGEPFRENMLQASVDEVAGTGVEVHLLQPGLGWVPWWKSKLLPAQEHYRWIQERFGLKPDSIGKYLLSGGDIVQTFIDRCREKQQVPFISLRLNDGHHKEWAYAKPGEKIAMGAAQGVTKFYDEHPEYRLGPSPTDWMQRVHNWAIPEARAHKLAMIQELCAGYDFEGLELDFLRNYSFFDLAKTTREERCAIMNGFLREVRAALDAGPRKRWLCVRVPCYFIALDAVGIDVAALAEAGVDMVNVSASYFTVQQSDFREIRKKVPTSTAVYLELCHSTWNGKRLQAGYDAFGFRRTTPEQYYTAAHHAYARGADGVSTFNFVYYREHGSPGRGPFAEPPFQIFQHLGDREWLAQQPQHWFLAPGWLHPFSKDRPMPRKVEAKAPTTFTLDLAPPSGGWKTTGRLRIQAEVSMGSVKWKASCNGQELTPTDDVSEPYPNPYPPLLGVPENLRAWSVPADLLKDGPNEFTFSFESGRTASLTWLDLALS